MKKILIGLLCALAAVSMAACSNDSNTSSNPVGSQNQESSQAEVPNPMVSYQTLQEAGDAIGFDIITPASLPDGFSQKEIFILDNRIVQVVYQKEDQTLFYRVGKASEELTDISGDYNQYDSNQTVSIHQMEVMFRGDGTLVSAASWKDNDFLYSLRATPALTEQQMQEIISSIPVSGGESRK